MSDSDSAALGDTPTPGIWLEPEALRKAGVAETFGAAPVIIEIGFGHGDLLVLEAARRPECRFLGIEVSRKRVAKTARKLEREGLENAYVLHAPAEYVLDVVLSEAFADQVWVHCPDPWPKRRHAARRLFQPEFVVRVERVLKDTGRLLVSTDDPDYARWIDRVLRGAKVLHNRHAPAAWSPQPPPRAQTAYEREWLELGREIAYFEYGRDPRTRS